MRFSRSDLKYIICGFLLMFLVVTPVYSLMGMFVDPVTADLGISKGSFSISISVNMFVTMLGCIFIGRLLEKHSVRAIAALGVAGAGISDLLFTLCTQPYQFWMVSVLLGCSGVAAGNAVVSVMISRHVSKERLGRGLGIAMSGTGVGGVLLSPLLSAINNGPGWRWSYRLFAVISLCVTLPLVLYLLKDERTGTETGDAGTAASQPEEPLKPFRNRSFVPFLVACATVGFCCSLFSAVAYSFFCSIDITPAKAALLISMQGALLTVFKPLFGVVEDRLGAKTTGCFTALFLAICYTLFLFCPSAAWLCIPAVLFYALGNTHITVCMPVLTGDLLGYRGYARLIGYVSVASWGGQSLAPFIGQRVYDISGTYLPAIRVGVACGAVALAGLLISYAFKKKAVPETKA